MEIIRDVHGREARPGDLIRVYHYRDRSTRRKCYMHKLLALVTDDLEVAKHGTHLFAVDVADIWKHVSLQSAHKCLLSICGPFEIIDGLSSRVEGNLQTWYERPKVKE